MGCEEFRPGAWRNEPAFIIGGGPSVRECRIEKIQGCGRIIATNRGLELPIKPDIWTWADLRLWMWALYDGLLKKLADAIRNFHGLRVTRDTKSDYEARVYPRDVLLIPYTTEPKLGESFDRMHGANNTGFWALNMAYLLGANPIVLIGFDCATSDKGQEDSADWWHGGYPEFVRAESLQSYAGYFQEVAKQLDALGVTVFNASPLTELDCWPVMELDDALAHIH